eukprot:gene3546-2033_t
MCKKVDKVTYVPSLGFVKLPQFVIFLEANLTDNRVFTILEAPSEDALCRLSVSDRHSVTCDGYPANFDSMRYFECEFETNLSDIKGSFSHKAYNHPSFFIPEACHMLKLARNALADLKFGGDAMEYLKNSGHPDFVNAEGTIGFIRVTNQVFDLLNLKNPFGNGFKKHFFCMMLQSGKNKK